MPILFFLVVFFFSNLSFAAPDEKIGFKDLDQGKVDSIHKELSANFTHTSVSPGQSLGDLWGIEVGAFGSSTASPELDYQRKNYSNLPYAEGLEEPTGISNYGLLGRFSFSRLLFEARYFPETDGRDFTTSSQSGAIQLNIIKEAKWFSKKILLDISLKGHYSKSTAVTVQKNNTRADLGKTSYENKVRGGLIFISSNSFLVEPYIAGGYVKSSGSLAFAADEAGGAIFASDSSLAGKTLLNMEQASTHFIFGLQFDLFIVNLSMESAWLFDTQVGSLKLSLKI